MESSKFSSRKLSTVTSAIYHAGREARSWVSEEKYGVPFLSSSDILKAELTHLPLLSKRQVERNPGFLIRKGWTLITRSGTIGRMVYVRPDMDGMACSETQCEWCQMKRRFTLAISLLSCAADTECPWSLAAPMVRSSSRLSRNTSPRCPYRGFVAESKERCTRSSNRRLQIVQEPWNLGPRRFSAPRSSCAGATAQRQSASGLRTQAT